MEEQKVKHINEFKKGEIITRLQNYNLVPYLDDISGEYKYKEIVSDNASGIGVPYEFVGILNGKIIVKYTEESPNHKKGEACEFYTYEVYKNGWAKYIDPKTLEEPKERMLNKEDAQIFLEDILKNS